MDTVLKIYVQMLEKAELKEMIASREKLTKQVASLRDELAREISLCASLESSQAALMRHVSEMDDVIRSQREEVSV